MVSFGRCLRVLGLILPELGLEGGYDARSIVMS